MKHDIIFFQSTNIGGYSASEAGLFELFSANLDNLTNLSIFEEIQVVVPNQPLAIWLRDKLTQKSGICSNLDFVVLLGPVLSKIFLENNPNSQIFDFNHSKYIIYEYLCETKLEAIDAREINGYLYQNGILNKLRAYQLSSQLQQIFHEYLYLRTQELINLTRAKIPEWQKQILQHLFNQIGESITFLDIYKYFANLDLAVSNLSLPKYLFIFGLTSVYPSQLQIIKKLATKISVYWYYKTCSFEYYGDLLSIKSRAKLEKKVLKYPELSLDDLYLTDANPLLANLGQQSREFIELLRANDIDIYDFRGGQRRSDTVPTTFLSILQDDIKNIKYRICKTLRLNNESGYYVNPIKVIPPDSPNNYDLADGASSVKINVCHNKMREVQVMFNEIAQILNKNSVTKLDEILITAPDIDDYAPYIRSVFANEFVQKNDGTKYKIYCNVTGDRRYQDYKILDTLKIIINAPYNIPVNYFMEILTQAELQQNLDISTADIDLVKKWLLDNKTYFGYNASDYTLYGYENYGTHSFKQFLQNIVLGACLTEEILLNNGDGLSYRPPGSAHMSGSICPYDNIDSSQIDLCNKLISLIEALEEVRQLFYIDANHYKELTLANLHEALTKLQNYLVNDDESLLISQRFLGELLIIQTQFKGHTTVNLPVFNLLLDEYINDFNSRINFNGAITCASMQYMRNIPYKYIYVLGMNFSEFPRIYQPNQLSILAHEWYLADRNYNIEDRQIFLDILLAAKQQLFISYIGRAETDNSEIKPSPVLSLFLTTLAESFSDFSLNNYGIEPKIDFKNIIVSQSLHPFYNNSQDNFSKFWHIVSQASGEEVKDERWDFANSPKLVLNEKQADNCYNTNLHAIVNSFLYTNSNIYKTLGLDIYVDDVVLREIENFKLHDRKIAKTLYSYFEKYLGQKETKMLPDDLREYLILKGVVSYNHVGKQQFKYYYDLYQSYVQKRGQKRDVIFRYSFEDKIINIKDHLYIEGDKVIITDAFDSIGDKHFAKNIHELPYILKMQGIIVYSLLHNEMVNLSGIGRNLQVVLRQLSEDDYRDYVIEIIDKSILNDILKHYLESFVRPVLVHKGAIEAFTKVINDYLNKEKERDFDNIPRNILEQAVTKAKAVYMLEYNNFDLEKIRADILFAQIANDYFTVTEQLNETNDILTIGKILSQLTSVED